MCGTYKPNTQHMLLGHPGKVLSMMMRLIMENKKKLRYSLHVNQTLYDYICKFCVVIGNRTTNLVLILHVMTNTNCFRTNICTPVPACTLHAPVCASEWLVHLCALDAAYICVCSCLCVCFCQRHIPMPISAGLDGKVITPHIAVAYAAKTNTSHCHHMALIQLHESDQNTMDIT